MKRFKRIYIEITNICNMQCRFCIDTKRKKQSMSQEEFKQIINKIKDYTDYIYLHVKGEPLLHGNLEEILHTIEKNNLKVIITTNGTLLKEKKDILKNSKCIYRINISMHSIEQNNINKLNTNRYIEDILNASNEISDKNNAYISYRFWNLYNIQDIKKNQKILNYIGEKYNIDNITSKIEKNSFIKINNRKYINFDTVFNWPSIENKEVSNVGRCHGLIDQIAILVDGTVVICCLDQNGKSNLGNIFNDSLKNILNSSKAKNIIKGFKENKLNNELCRKCTFRTNKRV